MKICANCRASLPDGAAFCVSCGSTEIIDELPRDNTQQNEQDYRQFVQGYDQNYNQYSPQYDGQYDNGQYDEQYDDGQYGEYDEQYDNGQYGGQYDEQYDDGQYSQQYDEQYDNGQYSQQYDDQYDNGQYSQQYDEQYDNGQYGGQYDDQYDNGQYGQQYDDQYDNGQYGQQYDEQYDDGQYDQQYDDQYDDSQYQENTAEGQVQYSEEYEDYIEPEEPAAPEQNETPGENEVKPVQAVAVESVLDQIKKDDHSPYEDSRNFKFEKKDKSEDGDEEAEDKPAPKNLKEFIAMLRETKDYTFRFNKNDIEQNQKMAIITCLGVTFWLPIAMKKDSYYLRFYSNQGLLILIVTALSSILYAMFAGIIGIACTSYDYYSAAQIINPAGIIMDIIFLAVFYAIPVFLFICAYKDIKSGRAKDIPLIGKFRLLKV